MLRSGQVVDIHANGPQIGALERYEINGARANTSYEVKLELWPYPNKGTFSLIGI